MRTFLAVFPPANVQTAAAATIEALRKPNDGVSWVKPDNLHYTLRFIGEVGEDGAKRIGEAAVAAAREVPPFDAALGAAGAFPNARRARVLWIGMAAGAQQLVTLATALEVALERKGFEPEGKKFSPHLTIGRVRDPRDDWESRLAAAPAPDPAVAAFRVERLCVVVSQLNPKGSIYTVREAAILGGW